MTGSTTDDSDTRQPGVSSAMISAARRSCAGLRNENRKQTAIASTPFAFQPPHGAAQTVFVERRDDLAAIVEPLDPTSSVSHCGASKGGLR